MLQCMEHEATAGECAEAPAATTAECAEVPMAGTSLAARFARLPAAVQDDILRQLDELSALEEEARAMQEPEQQGPRVSAGTLDHLIVCAGEVQPPTWLTACLEL